MLSSDERDFLKHRNKGKVDQQLLSLYKKERARGVPHVYLAGKVEFHGLELEVDAACLIPRQETELLVERALRRIEGMSVLDLCAGSGAIGLSIKKLNPKLAVTLSDISPDAISLCTKNALHHQLEVEIVEGDFLQPFAGRKFSAIVCNPPYVSKEEYEKLDLSVKDFEPKIALTDGGDGLLFYRALAKEAKAHLEEGGYLCLEIGKDQGFAVCSLFDSTVWGVELEKDYAGHDRFVFAKRL